MSGMRPITNGAWFEGSPPIETTTGSDVPTGSLTSGTRTRRLVVVASSTAAGRSPNFTSRARAPVRAGQRHLLAGMATEGEMPWMRGAL